MSDIARCVATEFAPESYLVYKPRNGSGVAMSLQLRLDPEWDGGGIPVKKGTHGLFLELAPETGKGEGGFPSFGWKDRRLMRVKLGQVDVLKLLVGIREVRMLGREVPMGYRPGPDKAAKPYTVYSYHKFGDSGTAINYTFEDTRSLLRISKSATHAQSIALDLHEELGLQMYLEHSLNQFFRYGIR